MSANNVLRVVELDFDSIKSNLKTFLRNQSEFLDFDFEGSGMNVLLDVLAYNTHYNAFFHNMVANEQYLDTAQLRSSVISWAKALNYLPASSRAATTTVNIKVTPSINESNVVQTLTLDRYTKILSEPLDGVTYGFVVMNSNTAIKSNGTFNFTNVTIKQGEVQNFTYQVDTSNQSRRFTIPSANTDTDTITVTVQESSVNTASKLYNRADDITELTSNSSVYFLEENSDANGSYTITFGDGVLGKSISNGNIIFVRYLDTLGTTANKANGFSVIESINGFGDNVIVSTVNSGASGASNKETISEIRKRAPIHYGIQNRAVTVNDYEALILKDYSYIDSVSVWSGTDNDPPIYGKVFISLKPKNNFEISSTDKELIKNEILSNRSILTVLPEIVDPDYTYILFNSTVYYNTSITTYDSEEIKSIVSAAIQDYATDNLNTFSSVLRQSGVVSNILAADESITSASLKIFLQKRLEPIIGQNSNYTLYFNTPLQKSGTNTTDKLYSYPEVAVLDSLGVSRNALFEPVPDSETGLNSIEVINAGLGYTSIPTVTISGDGSGATATAKIVNGKLISITIDSSGSNYSAATVTITGGSGSGAAATVILSGDIGVLRTYYYKPNGEKVIINASAGTINYDTGIIQLNSFKPLSIIGNSRYSNDIITFNVLPESSAIYPFRNKILAFDTNDAGSIQSTIISEN